MECPKCSSEMEKVTFHHVEVDRCTNCEGMWFDILEHEELKTIAGSESIDVGDPEKGKEFNKIDRIFCPTCQSPMIRMVDPRQSHIWYETCSVCNGIFFDAGEFADYKDITIMDFFKGLKTGERK